MADRTDPGLTPSVYFYGVVRGDHSGPVEGVVALDGEGLVYGIAHRELTVIVSDAHERRYEVSRKHVLGHETVVTALMGRYAVLPARFGSIRDREAIVEELLVAFYEPLHAQLNRVEGMVEVALAVRWTDIAPVVAEIVAADPWLQTARRRLAVARVSQNLRLDIGKRIEQSLADKRVVEAAAVIAALRSLVLPDGVHVNDRHEELKVLDASFLLGRDQVQAFTEAVTAYDDRTGRRYLMAVGTPTAPYGFVPLLESGFPHDEPARPRARSRARARAQVRR